MPFVLDACALIAYLRGERVAEAVRDLLVGEAQECFSHAVNLCEVFYEFLRVAGEQTATEALADLEFVGLVFREDVDASFWEQAARYKASLRRVSLADCFALALATRENAALVTSDHAEFDAVAEKEICTVQFIR